MQLGADTTERPPPRCDLCGGSPVAATAVYHGPMIEPIVVIVCTCCVYAHGHDLSGVEREDDTQRIRAVLTGG